MPDLEHMTDGELLVEFSQRRSEDCFKQIVQRHGPLVLRVCTRVLRQSQDAEDAAQAVFLTLARKAGTLTGNTTVAPWLHHVASCVSRDALDARSARRARERETAKMA